MHSHPLLTIIFICSAAAVAYALIKFAKRPRWQRYYQLRDHINVTRIKNDDHRISLHKLVKNNPLLTPLEKEALHKAIDRKHVPYPVA